MVCGVIPYRAAIERSVSPGATAWTCRPGGSFRRAVIGAPRATTTARSTESIGDMATRGDVGFASATAPSRSSSGAAITVHTGITAAMTQHATVLTTRV